MELLSGSPSMGARFRKIWHLPLRVGETANREKLEVSFVMRGAMDHQSNSLTYHSSTFWRAQGVWRRNFRLELMEGSKRKQRI